MTERAIVHPDLSVEQKHVDRCYERLEQQLLDLSAPAQGAHAAAANAIQKNRDETRDAVSALLAPDAEPLVLGRADFSDEHERWAGDRYYIARRSVLDEQRDPLAVNWEDDIAAAWYQATPGEANGLIRKRTFTCTRERILDIDDIAYLDAAEQGRVEPGGLDDVLFRELQKSATGSMRDIVASIQADQDRVIRAPADGVLVVQGGPGTGKTAIALHRVAVLLFRESDRWSEHDVLVVGPNAVFLQYIAQVLPSLGRRAVQQVAISALGQPLTVNTTDSEATRRVKGKAVLAEVVRRFIEGRITAPDKDLRVGDRQQLKLSAERATRELERLRSSALPYNTRREELRSRWRQALVEENRARDVNRLLRRGDAGFERALDRSWPSMSAQDAIRQLLQGRQLLGAAAEGLLAPDEQQLLLRPRTDRLEDAKWSADDRLLVEEAEVLLAGHAVVERFAHVVVDEAQDLSPMQLRALVRRAREGSMTILGDLAQAATPWQPESWPELLGDAVAGDIQIEHLSLGYRARQPILDYANRLLPAIGVDVDPPQSARTDGDDPALLDAADREDLIAQTIDVIGVLSAHDESVGVVGTRDDLYAVGAALDDADLAWGDAERDGLQQRVTLVPVEVCRGLEFDHVLVVEPEHIRGTKAAGLRLLYVALTRARETLTVLYTGQLIRALRQSSDVVVAPSPIRAAPAAGQAEATADQVMGAPPVPVEEHPDVVYVAVGDAQWRVELARGSASTVLVTLERVPADDRPLARIEVVYRAHGDHGHAVWLRGSACGECRTPPLGSSEPEAFARPVIAAALASG